MSGMQNPSQEPDFFFKETSLPCCFNNRTCKPITFINIF